jgi:hypothetical protein
MTAPKTLSRTKTHVRCGAPVLRMGYSALEFQ